MGVSSARRGMGASATRAHGVGREQGKAGVVGARARRFAPPQKQQSLKTARPAGGKYIGRRGRGAHHRWYRHRNGKNGCAWKRRGRMVKRHRLTSK